MPLWFLSGALFTPQTAWTGLRWVMRVNPLSYGLAGLQRSVFHGEAAAALPGWGVILAVSLAFAGVMMWLCTAVASKNVAADLQ